MIRPHSVLIITFNFTNFFFEDALGRGSPVPNPNMKFGGLPYEMHRLGGRNEVQNISKKIIILTK